MHVVYQLVTVEKPMITELTHWMRWNSNSHVSRVPALTVPLDVIGAVGELLADEGRTVLQTSVAELPPMFVPEVILQLAQRREGAAMSAALLQSTAILKEAPSLSTDFLIREAHAERGVTREVFPGRSFHSSGGLAGVRSQQDLL